jgi:hypothetical protein
MTGYTLKKKKEWLSSKRQKLTTAGKNAEKGRVSITIWIRM